MHATTLAQQLEPFAVDFDYLHSNYRPMLALVQELIGVIPNCDPLMEIWPTSFRTYNLLVPNALNLPFSSMLPLPFLRSSADFMSIVSQ